MASFADLRTAVHAAVGAVEARDREQAHEANVYTTAEAFVTAMADNDADGAVNAARRIAEKAAAIGAKPEAAQIIGTLERLDPQF